MNAAAGLPEDFDRHLAAVLRGEAGEWRFGADDAANAAHWDRVLFHGIAGLLAERIASLADWPEPLLALVRDEAKVQAFWEESHRAMLVELLDGLAQRQVAPMLMKGSALAYSLYAEPSSRRRGDSDLLVAKAELAATREVLAEQGFTRRDDPHGLFFQESWLLDTGIGLIHAVDLHWQPSDSPALQQVLRGEEFLARRCPLPRLSPHAAMPGLILTFLQGSLNQAWHSAKGYLVDDARVIGGERLIWAWDNHLISGQFCDDDWDALAGLAISRGAVPLVLAALELAQRSIGTAVPGAVFQRLRAEPENTDLALHLRETNRIRAFFTDLAAIQSLRDKCAFVVGHTLPDTRHLHRKYPNCTGWPAPLLHLRRIAESAWRWARLG